LANGLVIISSALTSTLPMISNLTLYKAGGWGEVQHAEAGKAKPPRQSAT
jgi:hypothetical protein